MSNEISQIRMTLHTLIEEHGIKEVLTILAFLMREQAICRYHQDPEIQEFIRLSEALIGLAVSSESLQEVEIR